MHLGWKAKNPAKAGSAKLEIFASRLNKPVASKELTADALGQNALSAAWCTGSIALKDLEWNTQYKDFFPDKVFTVEYSPYQARLTMEPPSSSSGGIYPKTAWTFFQILVDKT